MEELRRYLRSLIFCVTSNDSFKIIKQILIVVIDKKPMLTLKWKFIQLFTLFTYLFYLLLFIIDYYFNFLIYFLISFIYGVIVNTKIFMIFVLFKEEFFT